LLLGAERRGRLVTSLRCYGSDVNLINDPTLWPGLMANDFYDCS